MTNRVLLLFIIILLFSCHSSDFENPQKRNENWYWFVDAKSGEEKWMPVTSLDLLADGEYMLFFSNGKLRQKGKRKNKKEVDTSYYYDLDGKVISKLVMMADSSVKEFMPDGKYKSYFPTCEISGEGEIQNNRATGQRIEYYKNGKIKARAMIKGDTVLSLNYYESGAAADSALHVRQVPEGLVKIWYPNGTLKSSVRFVNGLKQGAGNAYYETGKQALECFYVDGREEGKYTEWYENAQMKTQCNFAQGKKKGKYLSWYTNGILEMDLNMKEGEKDGKQLYYYESGKIRAEREYKEGAKVGQWKEYDESGKCTIQKFVNGELVQGKK